MLHFVNETEPHVYGFEKKDLANIKPNELEAFRELAEVVLGYTEDEMEKFVNEGIFFSIESSEVEGHG